MILVMGQDDIITTAQQRAEPDQMSQCQELLYCAQHLEAGASLNVLPATQRATTCRVNKLKQNDRDHVKVTSQAL
jgi:hypothetical protein